MKRIQILSTSLVALTALSLTSCESPTATGALAGAGAGALTAAVFGGGRHQGQNMLIGAGAGAAVGALLGHVIGHADDRGYYQGRRLPYGRWIGRGYVESPYYPHTVVDTRGTPHGTVIEDPSTGRYFLKP